MNAVPDDMLYFPRLSMIVFAESQVMQCLFCLFIIITEFLAADLANTCNCNHMATSLKGPISGYCACSKL